MLADPAPAVAFDPGLAESWLAFTVSFTVSEFSNQFAVRNELKKRIFRRFREEQIEIPYPTRTIQVEGKEQTLESPPARTKL